jgi:hypothetical protein
LNRRAYLQNCLGLLLGSQISRAQKPGSESNQQDDWVCPMDPEVHSDKAGICPRCGMSLVLNLPDRVEYLLVIAHSPEVLKPGADATLTLRVFDPATSRPVTRFNIVHERLMHLFVVSENLEFFAHVHPAPQSDGSFQLAIRPPYGGMYRLLADYYPFGSVPQLSVKTLFVTGNSAPARLTPSMEPFQAENLTASVRLEPPQPLAGLETRLIFALNPAAGIEPYLGAWAHLLIASEDLIDLLHLHPVFADGGPPMQFNVIFPRPGLYRVWTQFQRLGVVNTTVFTFPVKAL